MCHIRSKAGRSAGRDHNYFTEMCSGSEEGSYLRLVYFWTAGWGLARRGLGTYRSQVMTPSSATCVSSTSPAGSNRLFQVPDLYWRSHESGNLWYKSRQLKKAILSHSEHPAGKSRPRPRPRACHPQPLRSNRPFQVPDLYWRSPKFGVLWYKSRQLKKAIGTSRWQVTTPAGCIVGLRVWFRV